MSRIEQLIKKLCPNGVNKKSLGEIGQIIVGGEAPNDCIKGNMPDGIYQYPIWANGQDVYGYSANYLVENDAVCISSIGANTGAVFYHKGKFTPIVRLKVLIPKTDAINVRYLYYAVSIIDFSPKKSSVPNMSSSDIKKAKIPVPPIEVQNEIVKILDNCTELKAELTAELTARKKQYEYYMDAVISRIKNAEFKKLDDCLEWITYGFTSPMPDTEKGPWKITAKDVHNGIIDYHSARHTSEEAFEKLTEKCKPSIGDVLLTKDGALGRTAVVTETNICINQSVALLRPRKNLLSSEYLNCLLRSPFYQNKMMEDTGGGTIKHIYITRVNQMMIPVPSLEEQKRIVNILDRFDKLCNDISEGLPAEIEARHKQYEYYRDKLLTFKEA